jgi:hypothetical protein
MLRGAPPAAGPTGTVGRARATPELHGAVRNGTAGCGLNRVDWPWTGRGSYASTHAHLGTACRETLSSWGSRAASGPEELRDWERTYASTHAYLGTAGRGTRNGTVDCERAGGAACHVINRVLWIQRLDSAEPTHCSCCCL